MKNKRSRPAETAVATALTYTYTDDTAVGTYHEYRKNRPRPHTCTHTIHYTMWYGTRKHARDQLKSHCCMLGSRNRGETNSRHLVWVPPQTHVKYAWTARSTHEGSSLAGQGNVAAG